MRGRIIIAVTGGRNYADYGCVERVLDSEPFDALVQGECPYGGLDLLAKRYCDVRGIPCFGLPAAWTRFGKAAGPIRNGWMFDFLPIYKLIAWPGDRGTANCVKQAHDREILVRDERGNA